MAEMRGRGRLPKLLIAMAVTSSMALLVGPTMVASAAGTPVVIPSNIHPLALNTDPVTHLQVVPTVGVTTPVQQSSVPPDCKTILTTPATTGATKTFAGAVNSNTTTTYFFQISSPKADGTQANLEDCAYANGDPSNIKYEAQADNPPFSGGTVFTSLTVTAGDTICDRVRITYKDGSSADFTNLVGSGPNGASNPKACDQGGAIPEAPAAGLIALAGLGAAGAAAFVWRRRNAATAT